MTMTARIYRPAKTAMQSGKASTKQWLLEFEHDRPREIDPLMGWTRPVTRASRSAVVRHQGGGGRLCRAQRHRLPGRGAEGAEAPDDLLCRQFPFNRVAWTH